MGGPRLCRESLFTGRSNRTLTVAGVGWFLTRPGCHEANAGCGAEPHGVVLSLNRMSEMQRVDVWAPKNDRPLNFK